MPSPLWANRLNLRVMAHENLGVRVKAIRDRIARHQEKGGWRHPVRIVAVTKTHGPEAVLAARDAGIAAVGENRVQEALAKQDALGDAGVEWHLIGHLQRNKVRKVIGRFVLIHSVDRMELVEEIAHRMRAEPTGASQAVLVEVNCASAADRSGCRPDEAGELVRTIEASPGITVTGLMGMAPLTDDPEEQRRAFRLLRDLRDTLVTEGATLPELSMGMSGDYLIAVEEGATLVRLGTLLFGDRT